MSTAFYKDTRSRAYSADTQFGENGKPSLRESWGVIMKTVDALDGNLVQGYKEDIDTLLVFAGLFSAVVTAFAVESYQWLQQDPANTTNQILLYLSNQLHNETLLPYTPPPPQPLDPSSVRINTFWFLSLALALIDALFGLLCKQWVQEHQRQTNTHTPGQDLALRWWRYQSFEKWHVPAIISSLPIILELALFLFLAGLLDLLRTLHHIPFTIAGLVVGLALFFYLTTTILPGISIIREIHRTHPSLKEARLPLNPAKKPYLSELDLHIIHKVSLKYPNLQKIRLPMGPAKIQYLSGLDLICPYKSPQSWLLFRLFSAVYEGGIRALRIGHTDMLGLADWPSLDLNIIQRFSNIERCPDLYELKGYRWLVQETRNMPSMRPYLKRVLEDLPLHLVMPTVFDWWHLPVGKTAWSTDDIDSAFKSSYRIEDLFESAHYYPIKFSHPLDDLFGDQPSAYDLGLASQILCFRNFLATYDEHWAKYDRNGETLAKAAEGVWSNILDTPGNGQLIWVFFRPEDLLISPWAGWREGILLFYQKHWHKLDTFWQAKLVARFSEFILSFLESSSARTIASTLLASSSGLDFFNVINRKVCFWQLFMRQNPCPPVWFRVLSHIWRIHQPPSTRYDLITGYFPLFPTLFEKVMDDLSIMTSESVLEPFLDSFERCWDDTFDTQKERLVKFLSRHLTHALLPPTGLDPEPQHQRLPSNASLLTLSTSATSIFISPDSHRGLQFLIFVNNKLAEDIEFHNLESAEETINEWTDALECLRIFRQLPPGVFPPVSRHHEARTFDVLKHTMPRDTTGSITDRTIVDESAISRYFLGSGDTVLREEEAKSRDGSSASGIFESDWEYSEMAGLAAVYTIPRNGDERGGRADAYGNV